MTGEALRSGAALLLLGAAASAACAEQEGARAGLPFAATLSLEDPDGEPRHALAGGQPLVLVLRVSNQADVRRSVPLRSAQSHDFTISGSDGRELWRWSEGRSFAQVLGELALAPGQEREFRATWLARDAEGAPLPAGRYLAVGWVGDPESGVRTEGIELRID